TAGGDMIERYLIGPRPGVDRESAGDKRVYIHAVATIAGDDRRIARDGYRSATDVDDISRSGRAAVDIQRPIADSNRGGRADRDRVVAGPRLNRQIAQHIADCHVVDRDSIAAAAGDDAEVAVDRERVCGRADRDAVDPVAGIQVKIAMHSN